MQLGLLDYVAPDPVAARAARYVRRGMPERYAVDVARKVLLAEARGPAPPCACPRCRAEARA